MAEFAGSLLIRGRSRWLGLSMGWGSSVIAGWKRGACLHAALVACPRLVHPAAGGSARERDLIYPLLAQQVGDGGRDGGACRRTHGAAGCRAGCCRDPRYERAAPGGRRAKQNGYGPVGKGGNLRGLLLHAVLAVDAGGGGILGLVDATVWNCQGGKVKHRRTRKTPQKELQRWVDGTLRAGGRLAAANSVTVVSDRESDMYEHFARRPASVHLIVRACQNRQIESDEADQIDLLFEHADKLPEQGRFAVKIPAAPGRKTRGTELAVRFCQIEVCKPLHETARDLPASVRLTLVDLRETSTPEGGEPIYWRLLTTHQVATLGQARRIIDFYRMRWTIEEYFHTLKTAGFDIEAATSATASHDQIRHCRRGRCGNRAATR